MCIKDAIDAFVQQLITQHGDLFNQEADKFPFKTFLFKSRANKLLIEDLQKSLDTPGLDTPGKIKDVRQALNIP